MHSFSSLRVGATLLAALLMAACASEEQTASVDQEFRVGLGPPIDMRCRQMSMFLPVDPNTASQYIAPDRRLALDPTGAAQLLITIKSCSHFSAGEVEYGPLEFFVVWLLLEGPYEIRPVPGAVITLPTYYAQYLRTFFDSKRLFQDMHKLGLEIKVAKNISLGAVGEPGYVYERGDVGFAWYPSGMSAPVTWPMGINIVAYRDQDVIPSIERITCTSYARQTGFVALSVHPESLLAPFGADLVGIAPDADAHCAATFEAQ